MLINTNIQANWEFNIGELIHNYYYNIQPNSTKKMWTRARVLSRTLSRTRVLSRTLVLILRTRVLSEQ